MVSNEKFCLRWNDFESKISGAFREIREEKDLFDCTLSCGSRQIQAHKLILSACSPFFRNILRQNPHQHPLLYLRGVAFTDLQSVLSFMYHGEVNVAQEELNSFLAVAEDLKVKGLTQNSSESNTTTTPTKPISNPTPNVAPQSVKPKSYPRNEETARRQALPVTVARQTVYREEQQYSQNNQEVMPIVKTEPEQVTYPSNTQSLETSAADQQIYPSTEVASVEERYDDGEAGEYDYSGYGGEGEQEYREEQYQGGHDQNKGPTDSRSYMNISYNDAGVKVYSCQICGKAFKKSSHVKTHIENVHATDEQVLCNICNKTFKNRNSLNTHKRIIHQIKDQEYENKMYQM